MAEAVPTCAGGAAGAAGVAVEGETAVVAIGAEIVGWTGATGVALTTGWETPPLGAATTLALLDGDGAIGVLALAL